MKVVRSLKIWWPHPPFVTGGPETFIYALALVAITTVAIGVAIRFADLGHVGAIYLIPVLISAMRWGLAPALLAATASAAASAFFFYPPIYSFLVQDWEQLVDLILFVVVALVTSQLAVALRRQGEIADRALAEARMRVETDHLRDALIGSVSHELRTPLSSILGASTVISRSPTVMAEPRLAALANVVRDEAERLNNDIQNLLDASRISSEGVRPRLEWAEPSDIVNAALERCCSQLSDRVVEVRLPAELPLVLVDAVLVEQALGQILGNAGKYSPAGSAIRIDGRTEHRTEQGAEQQQVVISVADQGAGVIPAEKPHLGERFYRGAQHQSTTTGSGLGLWIATAFMRANGGSVDIESDGKGRGATVSIRLPVFVHEPGHEPAEPAQ